MAIIAGIMTHIAFYELLPTSLKYKNKKLTYLFFLIGIVFMLVNHFIFG
jgi:zinc transporter ZupT